MTLNGVMAATLRYFTEFCKPALQKMIRGGIYARVYCIFSSCTMSSLREFTFAISSPDEFLVYISATTAWCFHFLAVMFVFPAVFISNINVEATEGAVLYYTVI